MRGAGERNQATEDKRVQTSLFPHLQATGLHLQVEGSVALINILCAELGHSTELLGCGYWGGLQVAGWALYPSSRLTMSTARLPAIPLCPRRLGKKASFLTVCGQMDWCHFFQLSYTRNKLKNKRVIWRGGLFLCYLFNALLTFWFQFTLILQFFP